MTAQPYISAYAFCLWSSTPFAQIQILSSPDRNTIMTPESALQEVQRAFIECMAADVFPEDVRRSAAFRMLQYRITGVAVVEGITEKKTPDDLGAPLTLTGDPTIG